MALIAYSSFAANAIDSLRICFDKYQSTELELQTIQRENSVLRLEVKSLNSEIANLSNELDAMKSALAETTNNIAALTDSLNRSVSSTREQIQSSFANLNQTIAKKSQTGLLVFIVLTSVVAAITFFFGRLIAKRGNEVASLSTKADKLNEEIVNRLTNEMSEIQTISKQIGSISTAPGGGIDTEQKLIITLSDRITFMEMTLFKMDSSVRGHKQLSKSIKQMKDNLLANGYELVDMLGKDYHDGMKVTANFVEDENLPDGKQIITGIIKPQINYQGKMIQSAQITVSQNL